MNKTLVQVSLYDAINSRSRCHVCVPVIFCRICSIEAVVCVSTNRCVCVLHTVNDKNDFSVRLIVNVLSVRLVAVSIHIDVVVENDLPIGLCCQSQQNENQHRAAERLYTKIKFKS